jgi:hypothetical protein
MGFKGPRVAPAAIKREDESRFPCSNPREPLGGLGSGRRGLLSCGSAGIVPAIANNSASETSDDIGRLMRKILFTASSLF